MVWKEDDDSLWSTIVNSDEQITTGEDDSREETTSAKQVTDFLCIRMMQ